RNKSHRIYGRFDVSFGVLRMICAPYRPLPSAILGHISDKNLVGRAIACVCLREVAVCWRANAVTAYQSHQIFPFVAPNSGMYVCRLSALLGALSGVRKFDVCYENTSSLFP